MPLLQNNYATVDPTRDGQVAVYASPEALAQGWFAPERRVVFVNGMLNSGEDHASSARALSLLQGCPVIGVYNASGQFLADVAQCLTDKLTLVGAQSGGFDMWARAVDAAYDAQRARNPALSKVDFVGDLIAGNAACTALYRLLTTGGAGTISQAEIFCHSQGNLIVSNALTAVALAKGVAAISGTRVHSFGSPCRYWPQGLNHVQRGFTFDPITWLDLRTGFEFDKVGFVAAHGFLTYLRHDAEFSVNRFRWGGWGLTASMDEEGLAGYCVQIGNNPTRLIGIFERLIDAHWSDSDDVAEIYARQMREGHRSLYEKILRETPKVGQLLTRMLDEGWTSGGEQAEIDFIASV